MQCSCIRTEKYLKICKSETQPNMGRDLRTIVFLTLGIIPIGPANILCIVSNFIYSFYTLYFFTFQLDNGVT